MFVVCLPHGTEQGTLALLLQRLNRLVGKGSAGVLEGLEAGVQVDEGELEAQRCGQSLKHAAAGGDDLGVRQSSYAP